MTPSDLRSRLASLGYREGIAPGQAPARPEEERPARALPDPRRRAPAHPIDSVVEGERVATPHGECFVALQRHPAGHPHGCYRLDDALEADPQVLAWVGKDPRLAGLDLSRCAFLDTETTGLAGGTGTYAFLVGLGFFEGSSFVVRQLFMEDYDGEEALLHALAEALAPFAAVVSFNGKAFDLPLLDTRFSLARRPFPARGLPHLDLLFPSRRLWRDRLESCALGRLEEAFLGVERDHDVPSWAIPGIYFDYLRQGDARPLGRVFEHNRLDILSLATLALRLARQYADPFQPELEDGRDLCALGAAFEDLEMPERAIPCYERATALDIPAEVRGKAMMRLGMAYKRMRQREDAVALWRRLAESSRTHTLVAQLELAKHYEHVGRDYGEAERFTLQALATLELRAARGEPWPYAQPRRELEHRLARLRRKMAR